LRVSIKPTPRLALLKSNNVDHPSVIAEFAGLNTRSHPDGISVSVIALCWDDAAAEHCIASLRGGQGVPPEYVDRLVFPVNSYTGREWIVDLPRPRRALSSAHSTKKGDKGKGGGNR
jgi:hypothetical protein